MNSGISSVLPMPRSTRTHAREACRNGWSDAPLGHRCDAICAHARLRKRHPKRHLKRAITQDTSRSSSQAFQCGLMHAGRDIHRHFLPGLRANNSLLCVPGVEAVPTGLPAVKVHCRRTAFIAFTLIPQTMPPYVVPHIRALPVQERSNPHPATSRSNAFTLPRLPLVHIARKRAFQNVT